MQPKEDQAALLKLAQLYRCLYSDDSDEKFFKKLCSKEASNNYQLPNYAIKKSMIEKLGNTILHFVALGCKEPQTLDFLLNSGADFTIKNQVGCTAVRKAVGYNWYFLSNLNEDFQFSEHENIKLLLAAHIKFNNFSNPCDNYGMTHFHIACIFNDVEVIKYFLKNGVPIDHGVNADSEEFAGYSPLHFAVKCLNQEVTETLLNHGANMCMKDAEGMTPLHFLIEQKIRICHSIGAYSERESGFPTDKQTNIIERNEKMSNLLLQKNSLDDVALFDNVGLSLLHIACTMQDSSQVESMLEGITNIYQAVPTNSSIWPGYTALHFAANCNAETVKILMKRGANIEAKDAEGVTPFDICVSKQKIEDIRTILSYKLEWKYIQFLYSKIKLIDLLSAMKSSKKFGRYLNNQDINVSISSNAPLWPGYTPLHLAVVLSERFNSKSDGYPLIEECLSRGADVAAQDAYGSTPLHLAFKLKKYDVVKRLLKSHYKAENLVDEEGLSHLHIACVVGNCEVIEKLVNEENVNIAYSGKTVFNDFLGKMKPGDTPLHIAVSNEYPEIVRILLAHGADVNKSNFGGLTPIHEADDYRICVELLSSPNLKNCAIPGVNFSHLHVACECECLDAVRRLIELGADVNAAIFLDGMDKLTFLDRYSGWTPLHFAVDAKAFEVAELLIQNGADIFVRANRDGSMYLDECIPMSIAVRRNKAIIDGCYADLVELFAKTIKNNESLQHRMEKEFGITMLHLWCYLINLESIQTLVQDEKVNVNARVREDSVMWPGYTPLHVLIVEVNSWDLKPQTKNDAHTILQLLLKEGADVTLADTKGNTPIHLSFEEYKAFTEDEDSYRTKVYVNYFSQIKIPKHSLTKTLMKHHKDFTVNPVNEEGISYFHIAVTIDDLDMAKKFLEQKVDVNQTTNYFNVCAAGYTPLHYAVDVLAHKIFNGSPEYSMVELLLNNGADANVEDVCGNTPLHLAVRAKVPRDDLLKILVRHGADINKKNSCFQTPFELMLSDDGKLKNTFKLRAYDKRRIHRTYSE